MGASKPNSVGGPRWDVNLDHYINRFLPQPPAKHLPPVLGRFLGHHREEPKALGNLVIAFWAFAGTLGSLSLIEAVSRHVRIFEGHSGSRIIGSFGAAAVLEFWAIQSPLAQPRNHVLGQLIASIVGVAISKGLAQDLSTGAENLRWLAGAASCASTTVLMGLTGTVHPPAGATALLAVTSPSVIQLGWKLVPLVVLSSTLMLTVALLINNLQRRFPQFWWTSEEVGGFWSQGRADSDDCEQAKSVTASDSGRSMSSDEWRRRCSNTADIPAVTVTKRGICCTASGVDLSPEEILCLEGLCRRL